MSSGEEEGYKESKRLQGLAAESVPYSHETKDYWYTRFQNASALLEELWEHHKYYCIDCEFSPCIMEAKIVEFQKKST